MPAPWFATAVKVIPWSVLWAQAPAIIEASRKLIVRWRDVKPDPQAPERDSNLSGVEQRLAALEQNERSQAALLEQIAAQLGQLTLGLEVVAARVRLALAFSVAALTIVMLLGFWVVLR